MPIYEYKCDECERTTEIRLSVESGSKIKALMCIRSDRGEICTGLMRKTCGSISYFKIRGR